MNTVETQETLKGIAERIREMREIKGLTLAGLAERTGVLRRMTAKLKKELTR